MKRLPAFYLGLLTGLNALSAIACTTIIAGSKATQDGSIIIARNSDSEGACDPLNMMKHPARTESYTFHSNSIENRHAHNHFNTTLPANSTAYFAFPDWESLTMPQPSMEEIGSNDNNVAITATESLQNSQAVLQVDPYVTETGITEDGIPSAILPQATSARDGIRLLGGYIEKDGAGEGFGVAISDKKEAWYLETASGHHWLAQRIPDRAYFVSANQGRFKDVDFSDNKKVQSSGLLNFLISNGLYDPAEPFNFFKICMENSLSDHSYNYPRVRRLLNLYSDIDHDDNDGLFPVFPVPSRKMTVASVAAGLRDHYQGTAHDAYQNRNPGDNWRPISVMRASISHITSIRHWLPNDIATVVFIAQGMADLSAYVPIYHGLQTTPQEYQGATGEADDNSLFWQYRKLQALVMTDYPRFAPRVKKAIQTFEQTVARMQVELEKKYLEIYLQNRSLARGEIQAATVDILQLQAKMLTSLIDEIAREAGLENLTTAGYQKLLTRIEHEYHFEKK
ncbi:MAG: C69 family dipeptidase [Endozoicomonas sp.]